MKTQHLRLGFLASRNGSSMRAILAAIHAGTLDAEARLVVSNNRSAAALEAAAAAGVPTLHIPTQADPDAADAALAKAMLEAGVEWIVLSGYLRRLGPKTLAAYRDRILNIHPGPIPAFGGEGMYGRRVHEAVVAAGVGASAITIHLVDEEYDHGAVLAVRKVPLKPDETADSLEARLTALEPEVFVETLQRLASGQLALP
ncbi:formyltransferase family protein [Phenylobacterium sp.]|uniref:formyltransferase family protein n=1 Tax=Phenylobacterium sp. TaxID=1871053 RepID=UPI0035B38EFA